MTTYSYNARLLRVVDGDTAILDVDLGFNMRGTLTFRLYGIDTPERGEPGWAEARAYLTERLTNQDLRITTHKGQTFGRWLATIHAGNTDTSVNDALVNLGHAAPYRA